MRQLLTDAYSANKTYFWLVDRGCNTNLETNLRGLAVPLYILLISWMCIGVACLVNKYFIHSLEVMITRCNVPQDLAGAIFMAIGSSLPELFTNTIDVFVFKTQIGLGTVIGSVIFNISVGVGVSCFYAKPENQLDWRPVVRDSLFYILTVAVLLICMTTTELPWFVALLMLVMYALYLLCVMKKRAFDRFLFFFYQLIHYKKSQELKILIERKHIQTPSGKEMTVSEAAPEEKSSIPDGVAPHTEQHSSPEKQFERVSDAAIHVVIPDPGRRTSIKHEDLVVDIISPDIELPERESQPDVTSVGKILFPGSPVPENAPTQAAMTETTSFYQRFISGYKQFMRVVKKPWKALFRRTVPDCSKPEQKSKYLRAFFLCVFYTFMLSWLSVKLANSLGCILGIPAVVVGATLLAAGTSICDVFSTISATQAGYADMGVANALGSNVFDILIALGLPWLLYTMVYREPFPFNPHNDSDAEKSSKTDIVFLLLSGLYFLIGVFITRFKLTKPLGFAVLGFYIVFIVVQVVEAAWSA